MSAKLETTLDTTREFMFGGLGMLFRWIRDKNHSALLAIHVAIASSYTLGALIRRDPEIGRWSTELRGSVTISH